MSSSNASPQAATNQGSEQLGPWQEKLLQYCVARGLNIPVYHIASDRRGMSISDPLSSLLSRGPEVSIIYR
jgi:hypothetical protein